MKQPLPTSSGLKTTLAICGLVLLSLAIYHPVSGYDFVRFDDWQHVVDNPFVAGGISIENIRAMLTGTQVGFWIPTTWFSLALDHALWGMDPGGFHATNLVFHILNTLMVLFVFFKLTKNFGASLFLAALFACHPLRVESVAWVTERKDVLSTFFWLLAMAAYTRYAREKKMFFYILTALAFALSLGAKPMAVTLPCVLLLIDIWPLGRWNMEDFKGIGAKVNRLALLIGEKIPLFFLSAGASALTVWSKTQYGALSSLDLLPLKTRIFQAICAYGIYLQKTFWPHPLAVLYPHSFAPPPLTQVLFTLGFLAALTALCLVFFKKRPYLLIGWLWFVGTLVPAIGLVQAGVQAYADRFTYIPLMGIFLILAWAGSELSNKVSTAIKRSLPVVALALVLALAGASHAMVKKWSDTRTLFNHAIRVTHDNWLAHNILGVALADKGLHEEAVGEYEKCLAIYPGFAPAHQNMGNAYKELGDWQKAENHYSKAIRIDPQSAKPHVGLGELLSRKGDREGAKKAYQRALELSPGFVEAHNNLGALFAGIGDSDSAIKEYEQAISLAPGFAEAHYNLGMIHAQAGRESLAKELWQKAIRLRPGYSEAHNNLGYLMAREGKFELAMGHYEKALNVTPNDVPVLVNMGNALIMTGKPDQAISMYERALALDPNREDIVKNLSMANKMARKGGK